MLTLTNDPPTRHPNPEPNPKVTMDFKNTMSISVTTDGGVLIVTNQCADFDTNTDGIKDFTTGKVSGMLVVGGMGFNSSQLEPLNSNTFVGKLRNFEITAKNEAKYYDIFSFLAIGSFTLCLLRIIGQIMVAHWDNKLSTSMKAAQEGQAGFVQQMKDRGSKAPSDPKPQTPYPIPHTHAPYMTPHQHHATLFHILYPNRTPSIPP